MERSESVQIRIRIGDKVTSWVSNAGLRIRIKIKITKL